MHSLARGLSKDGARCCCSSQLSLRLLIATFMWPVAVDALPSRWQAVPAADDPGRRRGASGCGAGGRPLLQKSDLAQITAKLRSSSDWSGRHPQEQSHNHLHLRARASILLKNRRIQSHPCRLELAAIASNSKSMASQSTTIPCICQQSPATPTGW